MPTRLRLSCRALLNIVLVTPNFYSAGPQAKSGPVAQAGIEFGCFARCTSWWQWRRVVWLTADVSDDVSAVRPVRRGGARRWLVSGSRLWPRPPWQRQLVTCCVAEWRTEAASSRESASFVTMATHRLLLLLRWDIIEPVVCSSASLLTSCFQLSSYPRCQRSVFHRTT